MSHLIVEIPKRGPGKDNWIHVIAENWIEDEVLYLPDSKYSNTYKNQILKCGAPPDVESWDRHDVLKSWERLVLISHFFYVTTCF